MINGEVTAGVTPRGNPAAGPAYRSTCSPAAPGSFYFLIYGLASNSRSRTFQVNKPFPLGCLPLFARSCHYRYCPPRTNPPQPGCCANNPVVSSPQKPPEVAPSEGKKKQTLERFHIMSFSYLCCAVRAALHGWLFIPKLLEIEYLALCSQFQQTCLLFSSL